MTARKKQPRLASVKASDRYILAGDFKMPHCRKQHYSDLPLQHLDDGINLPEFGANMGSMVSIPQRDRVVSMVMDAVAEGGKIIAGGRPPKRDGAFFEPTIIDCAPDNSIAGQDVSAPC